MTSAERIIGAGLGAGRLAIGAGLWLAPQRSARALGFDELDSAGLALARVAATRDLILGAWQLRALGDERELGRVSTAVALADAGDALAFAIAIRSPDARRAGLRGLPAAGLAAAAGFWLASRSQA